MPTDQRPCSPGAPCTRRNALQAAVCLGAIALGWTRQSRSAASPKVQLDRLTFPSMRHAEYYRKHLRRALRKETRAADWGAEAGTVIEYRFSIDELTLETENGVLEVRCSASGELPGHKSARSRLEFSGSPDDEKALVGQVLEIVARGVITRLAQMEADRRHKASRR